MPVSEDTANALALDALAFLVADQDRLGRFLALTGATPDILRERLADPDFQASIFDYLLQDELLLIAFSQDADVTPDTIAEARVVLAGAPSFEI